MSQRYKIWHMSTAIPNTARFTKHLASSEGVYGLILVSGLIATSSGAHASSLRTLLLVIVTVSVF